MSVAQYVVTAAGLGAIGWVLWYFLFSTGPNSEAGGPNNSQCHVDIPMFNCSVYLDGEPMVIDGDVVDPEQMVNG